MPLMRLVLTISGVLFFFFTENPFKKHLLTAFSVLDFRYTKMNKVQYLSSKIHSLVRTGYIKY